MTPELDRAHSLQGKRAGFASRMIAAAIDIGIVFAAYEIILVSIGLVRALLTEKSFELPTPPAWLSGVTLGALIVLVLAIAWSGSGRTLGDAAIGLRVVTERGVRVSFPRAVGRAIVLVVLPVVSMAWIAVSRRNAGLHDLVCHTAVIYDWRPRDKRVPQPDAGAIARTPVAGAPGAQEPVAPSPVAPAPTVPGRDPVDSRPI